MGRWGGGGVGKRGMSVQLMGEVGKDFCPNFLQSFLENIDRRSCDDGGWQLIPIFNNAVESQLSFKDDKPTGCSMGNCRNGRSQAHCYVPHMFITISNCNLTICKHLSNLSLRTLFCKEN